MSEKHTPYTVEMVVGHDPKWKKLKKGNVLANRNDIKRMGHYETKWLGYDSSENTWEEGKKLEKTVAFTIEKYWNKLKEEDIVYRMVADIFLLFLFLNDLKNAPMKRQKKP